ncbi:MAG: hypothetical protein CTY19_09850 [Methylomonas sp.]|nr:MAG: hypothetical protein CTY19_09850 [Methylomonas sp.]
MDLYITDSTLDKAVSTLSITDSITYIGLFCLVLIVLVLCRTRDSAISSDDQAVPIAPSQLSLEEIAVLSGGQGRLVYLAIAQLYIDDHIQLKRNWSGELTWHSVDSGPSQPGLSQDVFREISIYKDYWAAVAPYLDKHVKRLRSLGLRHCHQSIDRSALDYIAIIFSGFWVIQGLGIPSFIIIMHAIVSIIVMIATDCKNTVTAQNLLRQLHEAHLETVDQMPGMVSETVLMGFALMGNDAIERYPEFDDLNRYIEALELKKHLF